MSALGKPLDIECPRCHAKPGQGCISQSITGTWAAKTHAVRWKAVGIQRPTDEDRSRDYWDFKRREQDLILTGYHTGNKKYPREEDCEDNEEGA